LWSQSSGAPRLSSLLEFTRMSAKGQFGGRAVSRWRARPWWQHVLRLAAALAVALVLLYVALPWWVPKPWLARQVAGVLSGHLGLPVEIRALELSWTQGVTIYDLRIANPSAFGGGRMLAVKRLRCELAPLKVLLAGRGVGAGLGWAECTGLEVTAIVDRRGQVNLAVLRRLVQVLPPPDRLAVRDAALAVQLPERRWQLRLDVTDLQYTRGRPADLGRVTMSAVLRQPGGDCPVTLLAGVGSDEPVAKCSLRFSRLDLARLELPALLGLPIKSLAGTARGRWECQLSGEGMLETDFRLKVKQLQAQPRAGASLPTLQHAEVSGSMRYDWYTKAIQLRGLRLSLPGLELAGSSRLDAGGLEGQWQWLEALDLSGKIHPGDLAAAVRGRGGPLPAGVRVGGDVKVHLSLRGEGTQLSSSLLLDATAAQMRIGSRLAKPAGRRLTAELRGSLRGGAETWRFALDQAELWVAQNRFSSSVAMEKLRDLLRRYLDANRPGGAGVALRDLAGLDWRGSWEIVDIRSLRDLLGWEALEEVRLRGRITGQWSLEHAGDVLLRCRAFVPAQTELAVGRSFRKPATEPMRVEVSCDLAPAAGRLERLNLWAGLGEAGLSISDGRVRFFSAAPPGGPGLGLQAEGRYALRDVGRLLACLPRAPRWRERLSGSADGSFSLMLAPPARRLHLRANLTRMGLSAGEAFTKVPGQPAELTVDVQYDPTLPAAARNRLELGLSLGAARLAGALSFGTNFRCTGQLRVADAAWLVQWSPALRRRLKPFDVRGSLSADFRLRSDGRSLAGELHCDADEMQFRLPGAGGAKVRGSAFRLRLAGRSAPGAVNIDALAVDWGKSSVRLSGTVRPLARAGSRPSGSYWPPPGVRDVDLKLRGLLALDPALRALLPAAGRQLSRWRAKGAVRLELDLRGDGKGLKLGGRFDAAELSFALGRHLRKPPGGRAAGRFALFLPAGLEHLDVRELALDAGAVQLRAEGTWPLLQSGELSGRLSGEVSDLRRIVQFLPALAPYKPAGGAAFELEYRRVAGRDVVRSARLTLRQASAVVRGRPCRLGGTVVLKGLEAAGAHRSLLDLGRGLIEGRPVALGDVAVAAVAVRELQWSAGRSSGFILAELSRPTRSPSGRVTVLCSALDLPELAGLAVPGSAPMKPGELTDAERARLARRAGALIARARRLLRGADLELLLRSERLRHFDPAVRAFYEVQDLEASATVKDGRLRAAYRCGLNGGRMEYGLAVDFRADRPRLAMEARVEKVLSGQNVLLQLAREFPGNTVFGTFSRAMSVSYPLEAVVMSLLDGRCSPVPVGTARTVTEDGLLRGRGAPKFITRIFPGLNLATYRYRRMTAFAEYRPDGSAVNDMIFNGVGYNIYIQGTTDAKHYGRYEIGVLLLASPQSPETLHRFRQGRIPILKFRARIENGRFYDEKVILVRPDEAAYKIFLENNIFYRLWCEAGRRRRRMRLLEPQDAATPGLGVPRR